MTDKQLREYCKNQTLEDLMESLVEMGGLIQKTNRFADRETIDQAVRTINFIKEEITNRVMG